MLSLFFAILIGLLVVSESVVVGHNLYCMCGSPVVTYSALYVAQTMKDTAEFAVDEIVDKVACKAVQLNANFIILYIYSCVWNCDTTDQFCNKISTRNKLLVYIILKKHGTSVAKPLHIF